MKGIVCKIISSRYSILSEDKVYVASVRKRLADKRVCVGDFVDFEKYQGSYVITEVYERKNELIRPRISNIDKCYIVISNRPEPDYILVDKLIINCLYEGIDICIIVNKIDEKTIDLTEYGELYETIYVSAYTGEGMQKLEESMRDKTCAIVGQSGVGKSSIINYLLNENKIKVGDISKHMDRGKHTTRHIEIYQTNNNARIIDTCGFSILNTVQIKKENLRNYFEEFDKYRDGCEFKSCLHLNEKNCKIKEMIGTGISKNRYDRYIKILNEIIEKEEGER